MSQSLDLVDNAKEYMDMARLIDHLEKAFEACEHPYTKVNPPEDIEWCNMCGATRIRNGRNWFKPHWRDVIIKAISSFKK